MSEPPKNTERLFPDLAIDALATLGTDARLEATVIGRVLEEGDTEDLRWLSSRWSVSELQRWMERYGSRILSRRSRLFWAAVLDVDCPAPQPITEEIWPL